MTLSNYRAISFDCFGTLVDWESGIIKALRNSCNDKLQQISDAQLIACFLKQESTILRDTPDILYPSALSRTYSNILAELDRPCDERKAMHFGRSIQEWPLFRDTIKALSHLQRHHKLVILSNIDEASIEVTKTRLSCNFYRTYTAQSIGSFKPALNNFNYLVHHLTELGIKKHELLHVSVSRFHDIEPAAATGIDTAWINRAQTLNGTLSIQPDFCPSAQPTYTFGSLAELISAHKAGH
jgi:2-haloalkanoic acid dehalogenase type II